MMLNNFMKTLSTNFIKFIMSLHLQNKVILGTVMDIRLFGSAKKPSKHVNLVEEKRIPIDI
jgi:hypothetical protein